MWLQVAQVTQRLPVRDVCLMRAKTHRVTHIRRLLHGEQNVVTAEATHTHITCTKAQDVFVALDSRRPPSSHGPKEPL